METGRSQRETSYYPELVRLEKASGRTPNFYTSGKSDGGILSMKRMNKGEQPNISGQTLSEFVEKSPPAKGNLVHTTVTSTQGLESASSGLDRVREAAKRDKDLRFTNLLHHIDIERLHGAYRALNHKASVGVDGVTWREYGEGLNKRLSILHDQIHSGRYRVKAVNESGFQNLMGDNVLSV